MNVDPVNVSVVIPHHNAAATLRRALDSVVRQTVKVREIIVVDDASSPDQLDLVRAMCKTYPQTHLIELPANVGPADARNAGWNSATGEWVAFLDSDDAWHPLKLALQLAAAENHPTRPLLVATHMSHADSVSKASTSLPPGTMPHIRKVTRRQLMIHNGVPTSSVLLNRNVTMRFPAGQRYCEDYELWFRLSSLGPDLIQVELPMTLGFKHPFGEAGLSAHLAGIRAGERRTFRHARASGTLSRVEFSIAWCIMLARFARRIVLTKIRSSRIEP